MPRFSINGVSFKWMDPLEGTYHEELQLHIIKRHLFRLKRIIVSIWTFNNLAHFRINLLQTDAHY